MKYPVHNDWLMVRQRCWEIVGPTPFNTMEEIWSYPEMLLGFRFWKCFISSAVEYSKIKLSRHGVPKFDWKVWVMWRWNWFCQFCSYFTKVFIKFIGNGVFISYRGTIYDKMGWNWKEGVYLNDVLQSIPSFSYIIFIFMKEIAHNNDISSLFWYFYV